MRTDQKLLSLKRNQQAPLVMLGATKVNRTKAQKATGRTASARSGMQGGND